MLIAEANVETERSGRYLVQLCQHMDKDEDALWRVAYPIGARLVGIGRRDHLTVTWTRPRTDGEQPVETPASGDSGPERRRT